MYRLLFRWCPKIIILKFFLCAENVGYLKYPNGGRSIQFSGDYDDVTAHSNLPVPTMSIINNDVDHDYEEEFEFSAASESTPLYDNTYAEVGPFVSALKYSFY